MEKVNKELITQGINVRAAEVASVFRESVTVEDNQVKAKAMLIDILQVYYGINPDNIPASLIHGSVIQLIERFKGITLEDLITAYKRKEIVKKKGVGISISELLSPVPEWWTIKAVVKGEDEKERGKEEKEALAKKLESDFLTESKKLYKEALKSGEWKGSPFHASTLIKIIFLELEEEREKELEALAGRKARAASILGVEGGYFGLSEVRILNNLKIIEAIKMKINI